MSYFDQQCICLHFKTYHSKYFVNVTLLLHVGTNIWLLHTAEKSFKLMSVIVNVLIREVFVS